MTIIKCPWLNGASCSLVERTMMKKCPLITHTLRRKRKLS